jgi:hypothetical protein
VSVQQGHKARGAKSVWLGWPAALRTAVLAGIGSITTLNGSIGPNRLRMRRRPTVRPQGNIVGVAGYQSLGLKDGQLFSLDAGGKTFLVVGWQLGKHVEVVSFRQACMNRF